MKRFGSFCLAFLLMAMTGCQFFREKTTDYKELVKDTLAREYSFTAEMYYGETTAVAVTQKTGTSDLRMEFSSPNSLDGLVVTIRGDEVLAEFLGIELDISLFEIPTQSVVTLLREVLTMEQPENITVTVEEDKVIASGSMIIAGYEIVFDKETMAILSIAMPSANAALTTSDFVFLDE